MRIQMIKKIVLTTIVMMSFLTLDMYAATSEETIKDIIVRHSIEMNVDPALALSIAKKESGFKHELRSSYGAVGVFQILPSTARKMGYNPYHLSDNVKAGLAYYKLMYKMFGSTELALAAYNAGPGNVKKFGGTIPPYGETRKFVNIIMNDYKNMKNNPDPAIAKYSKVQKLKTNSTANDDIKKTPNAVNVPDSNEIPEVKQSEAVMEIL